MTTRHLTLIRHSISEIRADVPAARWGLSSAGLARARAFAGHVDPGNADRVFTSAEPKALQTARILARAWNLPVEEVAGTHEHERPEARIMPRAQFERTIREMFARPAELVFGAETADAAGARFSRAVMPLVAQTERDLLIVSHGTVMALFVSAHAHLDPFELWQQQQMPCAVTLALPGMTFEGLTLPQ